jgi:hypothetical protein
MPLNHLSKYSALTDAQYVAIGRAVVEWANIEHLLGMLLARLLATPDFLARTFTDTLSVVRLQDGIKEAVEIHQVRYQEKLIPGDILDQINAANDSASALRASRNKIAHFCWCRQSDEVMFGTSFAGGIPTARSQRRDSALLSLAQLAEIDCQAIAIAEQLMALIAKIPAIDEERLLALRPNGLASAAAGLNR